MEHIKELGIKEHIDKQINVKKLECFTVIVKKGSHIEVRLLQMVSTNSS